MTEQQFDDKKLGDEDEVEDDRVEYTPDYERVDLSKNKKDSLGCIGCGLFCLIIIFILIWVQNKWFSPYWLLLPIFGCIALWLYAERYEKKSLKVAHAHKFVKADWKFKTGTKKCYDVGGMEEKDLPDEDLYLKHWMAIIDPETIEYSFDELQKIFDKAENAGIIQENSYLKPEQLRKVLEEHGMDPKKIKITTFKCWPPQFHKTRNREKWDVIDYNEMAWVTAGEQSFNESMGWDNNIVPAAGWKTEHPDSATARVFHLGTLLGDFPCFLVTGCAAYDEEALMDALTKQDLTNILITVLTKLYQRADERLENYRKMLGKKREKDRSEEGRKSRESGERMLRETRIIRNAIFGSGNLDQEDKIRKGKGGSKGKSAGWAAFGLIVVVLLIFFLNK